MFLQFVINFGHQRIDLKYYHDIALHWVYTQTHKPFST